MLKREYAYGLLMITTFLCFILTYLLYIDEYYVFSIITSILSAVSFSTLFLYMYTNRTYITRYEFDLNKKIKSYRKDLVETLDLPIILNKNIVLVRTFKGILDIQVSCKKKLLYKKEVESCIFMLIDEDEVYIYIDKLNENVVSSFETKLDIMMEKKKNKDSILEDLDKTSVIKLGNSKKVKVSPIRNEIGE